MILRVSQTGKPFQKYPYGRRVGAINPLGPTLDSSNDVKKISGLIPVLSRWGWCKQRQCEQHSKTFVYRTKKIMSLVASKVELENGG